MKQSPLFAAHVARGAAMEPLDGWMMPARFGDAGAEVRAVRESAGILDLASVGTATFAGPDARRFCNGQFTNNVRKLAPGQGNRSAMLDDRGRVQGFLDLYCLGGAAAPGGKKEVPKNAGDRFLVVLDGVSPEWFEKRYEMYIVFDDVEMTTSDGEPWVLSVQGPGAADVLATLGLPVPVADRDHAEVPASDGIGLRVSRRDRTGSGGYDLFAPASALDALWAAALAAGARPVGHAAQDALRVEAGMPRWPQDGGEVALVHELGLVGEVCAFDKGCYIGQEVVNRVETQGAVQKRLCGLVLGEDALPPAGASVEADGAVVGTVTSAARVRGRALALGTLRREAAEPGSAVVVRAGGREVPATTSALPFPSP